MGLDFENQTNGSKFRKMKGKFVSLIFLKMSGLYVTGLGQVWS